LSRLPAVLAALAVLLSGSPGLAEPPSYVSNALFKIQSGAHLLTQETGLVPDGVPDSDESPGGLVVALSALKRGAGCFFWGAGISMEGNEVEVGPDLPAVGLQTFGVVPIRLTGQMEYWFLPRDPAATPRVIPYLWAAAGWAHNGVGTEIEWFSDPPQGAPLGLTLDDAPALGVGFGIHAGTSHGARFNAEVSYQWNQGDYTLYLADAPDRHGRFNLTGVQLLIGVTFG
jgi:hypothetical protein